MSEYIEKIKEKLTLSKMMEEEYLHICHYADMFSEEILKAYYTSLISDENMPRCNKGQTKTVLKEMRKFVINSIENEKPVEYANDTRVTDKDAQQSRIIYAEEEILNRDITKQIIKHYEAEDKYNKSTTKVEPIKHYKDVFNSKNRDFRADKRSGSLIIAENKDKLLLPGAPFCQSFGNEHFYYTSLVKNCLFDCEYCFLQGLYPCGLPVMFVNPEDYFEELTELLKKEDVYLCPSYDTDLMAFESILGYVEKWAGFAKLNPNLKIEIRTKTANPMFFTKLAQTLGLTPQNHLLDNVFFAWTISPDEVSKCFEPGLPNACKRIECMQYAASLGFATRACFDPIIFHPDWKASYECLFKSFFEKVDAEKDFRDMSLGVFRISNNLLKRMRDVRPSSLITCFPYVTENGACHYGETSHEMIEHFKWCVRRYFKGDAERFLNERVYIWEGK